MKKRRRIELARGTRRLAAIMFTDMVGFTSLAQSNESLAMKDLRRHNVILRPILRRYRGKEVKTMGDAFLVEFESALEATKCAIEMQRVLHQHNSTTERKLPVRIGIHVGDVIHRKGDVFGDAVNVASRIEPLAASGEICISEQVYDQIRNKSPYPLEKLETHNLKNITFPIEVYKVRLPWAYAHEAPPVGVGNLVTSVVTKASTGAKSIERRTIGKFFLNLTMKDRITVVKLKNDPEVPAALAKFSEAVNYGVGETLHIVSAVETMSVVVDSKNLEGLMQILPKKNVLQVYPKLAEIIISLPDETLFMPGFVSTISGELAKNGINILEYFSSTPQQIVIVDEKDALKSYQLLRALTAG